MGSGDFGHLQAELRGLGSPSPPRRVVNATEFFFCFSSVFDDNLLSPYIF